MWLRLVAMVFCILAARTESARILAIFPIQSPSHYILVTPLLKTLAERGHEITALTPFPQKKPLDNYRDIVILKDYTYFLNKAKDNEYMHNMSIWQLFKMLQTMGAGMTKEVMEQPEVKALMSNRNETFDLVIADVCFNEVLFGFANHFGAPLVGVAPFGAHTWNTDMTGAPNLPSFMPYPFLNYGDEMTFFERVHNFYAFVAEWYFFKFRYMPRLEQLYAKYFGHTGVRLDKVRRNASLVLLNQHFTLGVRRPYLPNMIEVGGMQVSEEPAPLPQDMKEFLDNATAGAIYFSLGTSIKSENMPREKLEAILNTFRSLSQRILWKFELTNQSNLPTNIFINSWFPQSDVLAHPNVKLFITHGGLLSTTEAIVRGKPVLGIPFFGDQHMNIEAAKRTGFALSLDYKELTEQCFRKAIQEMLTNASYSNVAQTMAQRYHDKPMSALDTAVYWVEYVIRHRGAPHMRCVGVKLNFIQYYSLDVIVFYIIFAAVLIALVVSVLRRLRQYVQGISANKAKLQ